MQEKADAIFPKESISSSPNLQQDQFCKGIKRLALELDS